MKLSKGNNTNKINILTRNIFISFGIIVIVIQHQCINTSGCPGIDEPNGNWGHGHSLLLKKKYIYMNMNDEDKDLIILVT